MVSLVYTILDITLLISIKALLENLSIYQLIENYLPTILKIDYSL